MNNQTLEKLRQMRLFGMHDAFKTSLENTIKEKMTEVMAALDRVTLHAPVRTGQVVLADVCGTGVDVVATRNMEKVE